MEDRVVEITNDGFPIKSFPKRGKIFIHKRSGEIEIKEGNALDENEIKLYYGLIPGENAIKFKKEWEKIHSKGNYNDLQIFDWPSFEPEIDYNKYKFLGS